MTTTTRRQAPDERAATDNPPTPSPSTFQTRTVVTPPSSLGNNYAQTTFPINTFKTTTSNLEISGPHLNSLVNTVNQHSSTVYEPHQAPQHIQRTTNSSLNHHTQTTHHTLNNNQPPTIANPPNQPHTITHLIDALTTNDRNIKNSSNSYRKIGRTTTHTARCSLNGNSHNAPGESYKNLTAFKHSNKPS